MDKDILVADLVSDNDAAFNKWIRTQRANDDINDFRIKKLMFSNFRKFETHEGKPYLVSFVDRKQQIGSLFMAGKNGSGKTSILRHWNIFSRQAILARYFKETSKTQTISFLMVIKRMGL